jgi:hypothetical protein
MGKNTPADENKENNVEVQDELGMDILNEQKASIEKELENFIKQKEQYEKSLERFSAQWERDKRLYDIMLENFEKLPEKVDMKFETIPEYWELKKKQFEDKYVQDEFMSEAKMEEFKRGIAACEEEITSAKKKLAELGDENE